MKKTNTTSSIITKRSYFGVGLIMTGVLAGGCLSGEELNPSEEVGSVESAFESGSGAGGMDGGYGAVTTGSEEMTSSSSSTSGGAGAADGGGNDVEVDDAPIVEWDVCPGFTKEPDDGLFKATKHFCKYKVKSTNILRGEKEIIGTVNSVTKKLCGAPPGASTTFEIGSSLTVSDSLTLTAGFEYSYEVSAEIGLGIEGLADVKAGVKQGIKLTANVAKTWSREETLHNKRSVTHPGCAAVRYELFSYEYPLTGSSEVEMTYWVKFDHTDPNDNSKFWKKIGTKTDTIDIKGIDAVMGEQTVFTTKNLGCDNDELNELCPNKIVCMDGQGGMGGMGGMGGEDCADPVDEEEDDYCGDNYCDSATELDSCEVDCSGVQRLDDRSYDNYCAHDLGSVNTCP